MHLPVTALHTFVLHDRRLLIVGQGPTIRIYDCTTLQHITTRRVLEAQPIHHIADEPDGIEGRLIVAGGRHIAALTLHWNQSAGFDIEVEDRCLLPAKEWALRVTHHEGSFLILTTNNNLYQLSFGLNVGQNVAVDRLVEGPGSFLYSGDVRSVSSEKILVAAGSVFGDVLVWECHREPCFKTWKSITTHRFEGHNGSVFGVSISNTLSWRGNPSRFVASCSDDRTFNVWNITEPQMDTPDASGDSRSIDTGFGRNSQSDLCRVASGWGHQSRIWDVKILAKAGHSNEEHLRLLTRGEDGTLQQWRSQMGDNDSPGFLQLISVTNDRHHSGKNVWSWTMYQKKDHDVIFTGGADGRVVARSLCSTERDKSVIVAHGQTCRRLPFDPAAETIKEYATSQDGLNYALTNGGHVLRVHLLDRQTVRWEMVVDQANLQVTKLCSNLSSDTLIVGSSRRILVRLHHDYQEFVDLCDQMKQPIARLHVAGHHKTETAERIQICLVVTSMSGEACVVWIEDVAGGMKHEVRPLTLPGHFVVTSSCFDLEGNVLVLGSRAGAMAVYAEVHADDSVQPQLLCIRHVHGAETVTSLNLLYSTSKTGTYHVLSTGRDGKYCIHRILVGHSASEVAFETVHRASPPFGPYIEGAVVRNKMPYPQLILYGFRSKDFVVWNETLQLDVFNVDCGGAHRSWAFHYPASTDDGEGIFMWTKAGTVNLHAQKTRTHEIFQAGGHGREIKALARCPLRYSDFSRGLNDVTLIAMGAEDTTIRMFALWDDSGNREIRQLCVLNEHTAGLQDVAFSACGQYLFSCGGVEELLVWRVSCDVPVVGIGVTLLGRMPHNNGDDDIRIMSISLLSDAGRAARTLRLAAAYSNGKVKVIRYDTAVTASGEAWTFDQELVFGTFCLMQVSIHDDATDESKPLILSAGTNGYLNVSSLRTDEPIKSTTAVHAIHQSSILAIDVARISPSQMLVATGGDDNAFGLTLVSSLERPTTLEHQFSSIRIPDAHTAALTSLRIARIRKLSDIIEFDIVTAGNDQRIHHWQVSVPNHVGHPEDMDIVKLSSQWTDVADVSCIEIVEKEVLVTGVGIQMLSLDLV